MPSSPPTDEQIAKQFGPTFWLPVDDPQNTSVLGYHAAGNGAGFWSELDWSQWYVDGHDFNYLHVPVKFDPEQDDDPEHTRRYRVRCWHDQEYQGHKVRNIGIGFRDGKLHWLVRCCALAAVNAIKGVGDGNLTAKEKA